MQSQSVEDEITGWGLMMAYCIKDNHLALGGGVREALRRAKEKSGHLHKIEVEVSSLDEVREAVKEGADIVLLDNMSPDKVREAALLVREIEPQGRQTLIEASGGITLDNVRAYAEAGVDLISIGALTHSAPAADISFKIKAI